MEISDELMTPGCPQCAVKHLSAALAIEATGVTRAWDDKNYFEAQVLVARAYVNYVEASEGYASHRNYARGLMVLAEETCAAERRPLLRACRLALDEHPETYELSDMREWFCPNAEISAHVEEAKRELPSFDWEAMLAESGTVPRSRMWEMAIDAISREYFDLPEVPEKGGETVMASCKKGKCAADKGGKAAKKAVPAKKGAKKGCCK